MTLFTLDVNMASLTSTAQHGHAKTPHGHPYPG